MSPNESDETAELRKIQSEIERGNRTLQFIYNLTGSDRPSPQEIILFVMLVLILWRIW